MHRSNICVRLEKVIIYSNQKSEKAASLVCANVSGFILSHLVQSMTKMPRKRLWNVMKNRDVKSFQTMPLCFRPSPKAIFSCISVHDRPGKWPKSNHCDLSQETDPHFVPHVHSDTRVQTHFQCSDKSSRQPLTPALPQQHEHFTIVN